MPLRKQRNPAKNIPSSFAYRKPLQHFCFRTALENRTMWRTVSYANFSCPPTPAFPNGHVARRPILQLTIVNGAKQISCYAILDSGADFCTFPLSFAIQLGLDPLQARSQPTAGLG